MRKIALPTGFSLEEIEAEKAEIRRIFVILCRSGTIVFAGSKEVFDPVSDPESLPKKIKEVIKQIRGGSQ